MAGPGAKPGQITEGSLHAANGCPSKTGISSGVMSTGDNLPCEHEDVLELERAAEWLD